LKPFLITPSTPYKNSPVSEVSEITEQTHHILTLDIKGDLAGNIGRGYLIEFSNENPGTFLTTYIINEKPVLTLTMDNTFSAEGMRDALRDYLRKKGSSIFEIESYEIINDKFYRHIGWNYNFPINPEDSLKNPPSPASTESVTFTKNPTTQDLQKNNTNTQDDISVDFNVQYWAITIGASYTDKEEALDDLESFTALSPQMGNAKFKVVALEDGVFSIVYDSNQYLSKNQAKLEMKDVENLAAYVYSKLPTNFLTRNHTKPDKDPDCACNLSLNTALITR
jgi:hypothetical protein